MGNIKAKWVGLGGIVFSDGKILDYNQLLPIINEIQEEREKTERDLSVANSTINQLANGNVELQTEYDQLDSSYEKLKEAAWDVVGESGLNDSVERMEKVLLELDDDLKLSAEESDRIFNEIQKCLHENCDGAPDGGHSEDCRRM